MKPIVIKVERTRTGFSAYAQKFPAFTTGRNSTELINNMVDSLNTYFDAEKIRRTVKSHDLTFEIEISSVFEVFPINIKALAERIGMNYTLLSQYATGKKKPSSKQAEKILKGIHTIGRELTEITLI